MTWHCVCDNKGVQEKLNAEIYADDTMKQPGTPGNVHSCLFCYL